MDETLNWTHLPVVDSYDAPCISGSGSAKVCKLDNETVLYTSVFTGKKVHYSPPEPFDQLVIPVTQLAQNTAVGLTVTFTHSEGGTEEQSKYFEPHSYTPELLSNTIFKPTEQSTEAEITLEAEADDESTWERNYRNKVKNGTHLKSQPRLGLPISRRNGDRSPIFLLSLDSVRYDRKDLLEPLLDILGENAVVPSEPRTQGCWTAPSHGSIFTGTHPATHGYCGGKGLRNPEDTRLHEGLQTLPELLAEAGYKNSAVVSHSILSPEYGFGRGFNRYRVNRMAYSDWLSRENDVQDTVEIASKWLTRDLATGTSGLFYFLHIFDPHHPYIPPIEYIPSEVESLQIVSRYKDCIEDYNRTKEDYLSMYNTDNNPTIPHTNDIQRLYDESISYTAKALRRFISQIKAEGLFDDSLIIVTGDHGEEFGERGFYYHTSLYDGNIRPFMAIKPPATADWEVPHRVDTIDIFPTIAAHVMGKVPGQCAGKPLQEVEPSDSPRITERLTKHWYSLSVEKDSIKAIYTFAVDWPNPPKKNKLKNRSRQTEYYDINIVRDNTFAEISPEKEVRNTLWKHAESFISGRNIPTSSDYGSITNTIDESKENLEALGYL